MSNLSSVLERKKKLGIIAGAGVLPHEVVNTLKKSGRPFFIVAFEGKTDPELYADLPHICCPIGAVGKIIKKLREENIEDLLLIGKVGRPALSSLSLDISGLRLLYRLKKAGAIADNHLFSTIINFLEDKNFRVLGIKDVTPELLAEEKVLTKTKPDRVAIKDIMMGAKLAKMIGDADVGQAAIVQQGLVLGLEAIEGTDGLIERCAELRQEGKGGVLIKAKKPNQDERIDLPAIGLATVENCHKSGLRGIAVEAGNSLVLEREKIIKRADELGMFIMGVNIEEDIMLLDLPATE